jgi:hypothetical protein
MGEGYQPSRRVTFDEVREELLANEAFIQKVVEKRNPPKTSRWYESPGLIAVLSALVASLLTFTFGCFEKRNEQRLESRMARLTNIQTTIRELSTLVSGLMLAAEDRAQFAKGAYDDLDTTQLYAIVDTSNAMDLRWRVGRLQSEVFLRFHFSDDSMVNRAWIDAREALQVYANCAERAFRVHSADKKKLVSDSTCNAAREASSRKMDGLSTALIRGYRLLERF